MKEIRREPRARFVACTRCNDSAPDLLEQIRRCFSVAALTQQIAIERSAMPLVKGFEGTQVAVPVAQHQFAVVVARSHPRERIRLQGRGEPSLSWRFCMNQMRLGIRRKNAECPAQSLGARSVSDGL